MHSKSKKQSQNAHTHTGTAGMGNTGQPHGMVGEKPWGVKSKGWAVLILEMGNFLITHVRVEALSPGSKVGG